MAKKYVHLFSEYDEDDFFSFGRKGSYLCEMTKLGLPVPSGFIVSADACNQFYEDKKELNSDIKTQISQYISKLEEITGKKLGDSVDPLILSVRASTVRAFPGMMDAIINIGLNDITVQALAKKYNPRFAWDCYRKLIQLYSYSVAYISKSDFDAVIDDMLHTKGLADESEFSADDLKQITQQFKQIYKKRIGYDFPSDPKTQIIFAVRTVFDDWTNPRANIFRRDNNIPQSVGIAVIVQQMVFGNLDSKSGSGILFTRDPATGQKKIVGEFLSNNQGEDLFSSSRTPITVREMESKLPTAYKLLIKSCDTIEKYFKDMQDISFTVESGNLYILESRPGKRTAEASVNIACDLVEEGTISRYTATLRVSDSEIQKLLKPTLDKNSIKNATLMGKGLAASPDSAVGRISLSGESLKKYINHNEDTVLVCFEVMSDEISYADLKKAKGILTSHGGMTSHGAVLARGAGICCVSGCSDLLIDTQAKKISMGGKVLSEGDFISIDGNTGCVYCGRLPLTVPEPSLNLRKILLWKETA